VKGGGGGWDELGGVGSIEGEVGEFSFEPTLAVGETGFKAGRSLPVEETGGTTVIAGGVLGTSVASRSWLPGRMMRLERLAGVNGGAMGAAGVVAAGGRIVGAVKGAGVTDAGFAGASTDSGAGDIALTGSGPEDVAPMAVAVAEIDGVFGSGGWKRRADLRRSGSIGGVMALDFRAASGSLGAAAGLISAGGIAREADLRMIGSTGGTMGVDFLTVSGGCTVGALEEDIAGVNGGGVEGIGVMAVVLAGIMGNDAVAEVMPGEIMPERRTNGAMEGFATGLTVGGMIEVGASGGGTLGTDGGWYEGATIGDDFATGSGMFGAVAGDRPRGGVTGLVGASGSAGFGSVSEAGRVSEVVIGSAPVSIAWRGIGGGVETSGGCGASGSGTRAAVLVSVKEEVGSGGMGVRDVSLSGGGEVRRAAIASGVMVGSVPVAGSAGGRLPCGTGARSPSDSVFPLRKTLACGLAMMTRGGASWTRPVAVGTRPVLVGTRAGSGGGRLGGVAGACSKGPLDGTRPVSGGAEVGPGPARSMEVLEPVSELVGGAAGRGLSGVGRTSGSVLAREPVSEADCLI